jgi:hypothetical protein
LLRLRLTANCILFLDLSLPDSPAECLPLGTALAFPTELFHIYRDILDIDFTKTPQLLCRTKAIRILFFENSKIGHPPTSSLVLHRIVGVPALRLYAYPMHRC